LNEQLNKILKTARRAVLSYFWDKIPASMQKEILKELLTKDSDKFNNEMKKDMNAITKFMRSDVTDSDTKIYRIINLNKIPKAQGKSKLKETEITDVIEYYDFKSADNIAGVVYVDNMINTPVNINYETTNYNYGFIAIEYLQSASMAKYLFKLTDLTKITTGQNPKIPMDSVRKPFTEAIFPVLYKGLFPPEIKAHIKDDITKIAGFNRNGSIDVYSGSDYAYDIREYRGTMLELIYRFADFMQFENKRYFYRALEILDTGIYYAKPPPPKVPKPKKEKPAPKPKAKPKTKAKRE
jgi:hypothetical protein